MFFDQTTWSRRTHLESLGGGEVGGADASAVDDDAPPRLAAFDAGLVNHRPVDEVIKLITAVIYGRT